MFWQILLLLSAGGLIHQIQVGESVFVSRDRIINALTTVDPTGLSSKGNKFVLAFWSNGGISPIPDPSITLLVTTDDSEPVSFTVDAPNVPKLFLPRTELAVAGQTTVITLPTSNTVPTTLSQDIRVFNQNQRDRGIRVVAEEGERISVYGFNDEDVSSDAFLTLPCIEYGENSPDDYVYYVFSADIDVSIAKYFSRFMIIPCEDVTQISIIPTQTLDIPADISSTGFAAQVGPTLVMQESSVILNALETAMFESRNDLTGTIIKSNKPITVIVGHECANVPSHVSSCDVLVEQVPPHITYGRFFLTAPLTYRESGERYRIGSVANGPNIVSVTCTSEGSHCIRSVFKDAVIRRGGYLEFDTAEDTTPEPTDGYQREYCSIESSLPVTVMQYSKGHSVDEIFDRGDPSMLYIPPVSQYINDYTVTTAQQVQRTYLSLTISSQTFFNPEVDGNNFVFNGSSLQPDNDYSPIYCSDLTTVCGYGAHFPLTHEGSFEVYYNQDTAGFFPFVYGIDIEESFEYPAGFGLEPLGLPIIEIPDLTVSESVGLVQIPIRRVGGDLSLTSEIVVNSQNNGSATEHADFEPIEPSLMGGHRLKYYRGSIDPISADVLVITIIDDEIEEPTESFEIYLVYVSRNAHVVKPKGIVTIMDDDSLPEVGFSSTEYHHEEGKRFVEIVIRTSSDKLINGGVLFYTEDETAHSSGVGDIDFTAIPRENATSIKFPIGYDPFTSIIRIPIIDDNIAENNETFFGRLILDPNVPIQGLIITESLVQVTIINDDVVSIGFDPTMYSVSKMEEFVSLQVKILEGMLSSDVVVKFEINETLQSLFDEEEFNSTMQLLTFSPGMLNHSIMLPASVVITSVSANVTSLGHLSSDSNLVQITQPSARVDITEDDPIPVVCTSTKDIYFVVDVTLSNFATPFCEEMYAIELIIEAFDSQTSLDGTRIGSYIYPLTETTPATGIRFFKIGTENCVATVENFHTLMQAVSLGANNKIRPHVLGAATYPTPALALLANDIKAEIIENQNVLEDRKRVIVTLTDGRNDGNDTALQNAVNSLKTAGTQTTLIAAGIATGLNTDYMDEFEASVKLLAGGVDVNTIISRVSGAELGRSLVDVMERNGAICKDQANEIRLRLLEANVYCRCNLRQNCEQICSTVPSVCRLPPTAQCSINCFMNKTCTTENMLPRMTRRQCCVDYNDGMGFKVDGDDTCYACVVLGFHLTSFTAPEQGANYAVPVGYIKNQLNETVQFNVLTQLDTASSSDFTLQSSVVRVSPQIEEPDEVRFVFRVDSIAQESEEILSLRLDMTSSSSRSMNVFFVDTLHLTILDSDKLEIKFSADVFSSPESELFIPVTVVLNTTIANPLTVRVISKTLTEHRLSGRPDPPAVLDDNSLSPIEANFADFDNSVITDTFTVESECNTESNDQRHVILVPIVNDKIDESHEQDFVVTLEIVNAFNMSRIALARQDSICRIIDDDDIHIGFESSTYTFSESDVQFINNTVLLRKENAAMTEQTLSIVVTMDTTLMLTFNVQQTTVIFSVRDGEQSGSTVRTPLILHLPTTNQHISFMFRFFDDDIAEGTETIMASVSSLPGPGPTFLPPVSLSRFFTVIIEDDDEVIFGFSETSYIVNETDRAFEICGVVRLPGENVSIITEINIGVNTISGSAGEDDYRRITANGGLRLQIDNQTRSRCFFLSIKDDGISENSENFTLEFVQLTVFPNLDMYSFILSPSTTTVTIQGDATATIGFAEHIFQINEGDNSISLSIEVLRGTLLREVIIDFSTSDGTALNTFDYVNDTRTFTFGPNTLHHKISVDILDNEDYELTENFTVQLTLQMSSEDDRVALEHSSVMVLILDDDLLMFQFETDMYEVGEEDGVVRIVLFLTFGNSSEFSFVASVSTDNGSAIGTPLLEADYITVNKRRIHFQRDAYNIKAEIDIQLINDDFTEDKEQFSVQLDGVDIENVVLTTQEMNRLILDDTVVHIIDNDNAMIGFLDADINYEVKEFLDDFVNIGVGVLPRLRQLRIDVVITVQTLDHDATAGKDYVLGAQTLTFSSGAESQSVSIAIVDDRKIENMESFFVHLTPFDSEAMPQTLQVSTESATVTIFDDDTAIGFTESYYAVNESIGEFEFKIQIIGSPLEIGVSVSFYTIDGSAVSHSKDKDFNEVKDRALCLCPQTEVAVTIIDDEELEHHENFTVGLRFAVENTSMRNVVLDPEFATVQIFDQDNATIGFDQTSYTAEEGETNFCTLIRIIEGQIQRDIAVQLKTTSGTAMRGEDYRICSDTFLTFNKTFDHHCIQMKILNDQDDEDEESFIAMLSHNSSDTSQVTIDPAIAKITIKNRDSKLNIPPEIVKTLRNPSKRRNHLLEYNVGMENSFCLENTTDEVNFTIYCNPNNNTPTSSTQWFFGSDNITLYEIDLNNEAASNLQFVSEGSLNLLMFGPASLTRFKEDLQARLSNILLMMTDKLVIACTLSNEFGNDTQSIEITVCAPGICQDGVTNNCSQNCFHDDDNGTYVCSCNEGFDLEADNETCSDIDCGPLTDPANGMVSYSSTTYNSTATYTCDPSYVIILLGDEATRTCLQNKTWSGSKPVCEKCFGGVSIDGLSCLEFDICKISHNCTGVAKCEDTANGTFVCVCPAGYQLQLNEVSCEVHLALLSTMVIIGLVLLLITAVLVIVVFRSYKKKQHIRQKEREKEIEARAIRSLAEAYYAGGPETDITQFTVQKSFDTLKEIHKELLIYSSNLRIQDTIGQGEFGVVYKGHLLKDLGQTVTGVVAIKTLKGFVDESLVEGLLKECVKMQKFDHPNVLSLIGVCLDGGPTPFLVMPYMVNGSLHCYLKKERQNLVIPCGLNSSSENTERTFIAQKRLLDMCYQIAKGMEYLASMRFVHRDLATRNCMIDVNFVIKVADFGLAEQLESKNYFRQDKAQAIKLPVKWLAPESLTDSIFSEKSDVWAFGVTCWEIFSGGKVPYASINPAELCQALENGYRMEKPANAACNEQVHSVIMECWKADPIERPSFSDLVKDISLYLESMSGYLDVGAFDQQSSSSKELPKVAIDDENQTELKNDELGTGPGVAETAV